MTDELVELTPDEQLVEAVTNQDAVSAVTNARRTLKDLPDIPASVNPINVILCYEMMGLDDFAISEATSLPIDTVRNIRTSEVYSTVKRMVVDGLIENARSAVQGVLNTHAMQAANQLVEATNAARATDRITAAKEILNRTGHSERAIIEHQVKFDSELRINYVKQDREFEGVTVEGLSDG